MKIIAESAFNHNGNLNYLKQLADASKYAKADFFTVQIYRTESFCEPNYSKYDICKNTELSTEEWEALFLYCKSIELDVIPCVLDEFAFQLAIENGFQLLKIHATDMLNDIMLELIAQHTEVKILLETQCATIRDINYAFRRIGNQIEAIFHGFSNYPTDTEDLQLNSIDFIEEKWGVKTGLADHSTDTTGVPLMALAKGVSYLEKHITVSRRDRNYDYQVSLDPEEFAILVQQIKKYTKALGQKLKHPVKNELLYRDIMYKKYLEDNSGIRCMRSDGGKDFYAYKYGKYPKTNVVISVIARLKSQRLKRKIFKHLHNDLLVFDLIRRLQNTRKIAKTILATSTLEEDREIVDEAIQRNVNVYCGDPLSVADRMLDIVEAEKAGAIIRITGDNPLTDPSLVDEMVQLYLEHDLDYVRVNNLPFGLTGELFSGPYLMKLYQRFNPNESEYLTWFVMLDKDSKKGCIDFQSNHPDLKRVGYSVDYQEDYDRLLRVLDRIGKTDFADISLEDIINNIEMDNLIDLEKTMKLPGGQKLKFKDYFNRLDQLNYTIRKPYKISKEYDLHHR